LGGARSKAEDDFSDVSDLDLPFGEPAGSIDVGTPAASAKKSGDDVLSGINFGENAA
jgi:broad specificity polyphosphatase/5'/3'-nucleotidase SurE